MFTKKKPPFFMGKASPVEAIPAKKPKTGTMPKVAADLAAPEEGPGDTLGPEEIGEPEAPKPIGVTIVIHHGKGIMPHHLPAMKAMQGRHKFGK